METIEMIFWTVGNTIFFILVAYLSYQYGKSKKRARAWRLGILHSIFCLCTVGQYLWFLSEGKKEFVYYVSPLAGIVMYLLVYFSAYLKGKYSKHNKRTSDSSMLYQTF